jgi:hypothetical protein
MRPFLISVGASITEAPKKTAAELHEVSPPLGFGSAL